MTTDPRDLATGHGIERDLTRADDVADAQRSRIHQTTADGDGSPDHAGDTHPGPLARSNPDGSIVGVGPPTRLDELPPLPVPPPADNADANADTFPPGTVVERDGSDAGGPIVVKTDFTTGAP